MTQTRRLDEVLGDTDLVDLFLANAPFLTQSALADLLRVTPVTLGKLASTLQILLVPLGQEPSQRFIMERIGHLPADAVIRIWRGGTIVKYVLDRPGFISVTHHFSHENTSFPVLDD